MGQVGITPLVLHPPRGVTPTAGAAGVRGEAEERSRAGSLHAALPALGSPKYGCWEMGTSRDPKRKGALGSCAARRTGVPRMGAPTEEQRVPTKKTGAGRPRIPTGEQSLERGSPRKGHRNGVRGKGLLSEEGAHDPGTGAPEFPE